MPVFETKEALFDYVKRERLVFHAQHRGKSLGPERRLGAHELSPSNRDGSGPLYGLQFAKPQRLPGSLELSLLGDGFVLADDVDVRVPGRLRDELEAELEVSTSSVRRLSTWPIERASVYVDVSEFSQHTIAEQVFIIRELVHLVEEKPLWDQLYARTLSSRLEAKLCLGDGYLYVFDDASSAATFGAYLASMIDERVANRICVAFHFRIGIHVGPVHCFWDPGREGWNYIGEGTTGGQRVLAAIGKDTDDVVFVSEAVRWNIMRTALAFSGTSNKEDTIHRRVLICLENRGRRATSTGGNGGSIN